MEYLDVVDENGNPTGEIVSRREAHEKGIRHRTSHVWIVKRKSDEAKEVYLLLQKRSDNKDSHPGCYDISSAGHITAGTGFEESAVREMKEELGIDIVPEELIYLGQRHFEYEKKFHDRYFHDNQISNVYMVWKDVDIDSLKLQEEEIQDACWMSLSDCITMVRDKTKPNCIAMEELLMLDKATR